MKKLTFLILSLLLASASYAKVVNSTQAGEVAVRFASSRRAQVTGVKQVSAMGRQGTAYYVVNLQPKGWCIVSADDVATPILGYSLSGQLNVARIPDNMQGILDEYDSEIHKLTAKVSTPHRLWSDGFATTRATGNVVEPLIQVNWNQSSPYNKYCPKGEALVGCVAVSMSQAMSVQRYPARPTGKVSFACANYGGMSINFSEQMAYNWEDILSGANNKDEVARLLYHAGMSVKMDYGTDGSGIPSNEVNRISEALKNNFSYPSDVTYLWRSQYDGDWDQLLINELVAGRAIVYNAIDTKNSAGHSFNLDGYDGSGHFHVNWGWGGTGNGYFNLDGLRDKAMNMDYDSYHVAVIGIGAPDQTFRSIAVSHTQIEEGLPAGSVVGSISVNGSTSLGAYQLEVHGTYDSKTDSYKTVPFKVENGMLVTTEVLNAATSSWNVELTVSDPETGESLTQGFKVTVNAWKSLEQTTSLVYDRATRTFSISTKHNVSYQILDANGAVIRQGTLNTLPELTLTPADYTSDVIALKMTCADESKTWYIKTK
jgi:hypothetical protein